MIAQWKWAINCLSRADEIIFMGFGFPPEDLYVHDLFAEGVARISNQTIKVKIYEKGVCQYYKLRKRIEMLFEIASHNYKVHYYCYQGKVEP